MTNELSLIYLPKQDKDISFSRKQTKDDGVSEQTNKRW